MSKAVFTRVAAIAAGSVILGGVGSMAVADSDPANEFGNADVEVNVGVEDLGALTITVAADSTTLTEGAYDGTARVFTGTLPTVTVSDTRRVADIPEDAFWYVLGTVSDFASGDGTIGAENLGWTPQLIDGGESGLVAEGDPVDPALDDGPGLVDQELFAMAYSSAEIAEERSWTADAGLELKTPSSVEPGSYSATLTLSLFE